MQNDERTIPLPGHTETVGVRESMKVLPGFMQPFLTWLTGRAYSGQKPWVWTASFHFWTACLTIVGGIFLSASAFYGGGLLWLFLFPGWLLTVSGARKMQSMIVHQCAHTTFATTKRQNFIIGSLLSAIFLFRDFRSYSEDHGPNHHGKFFLTTKDETPKFLFSICKLEPGMSRKQCWQRLTLSLFSPVFHLKFFWARVVSCFSFGSPLQGVMATISYALIVFLLVIFDCWLTAISIWFFPLIILYQISTTIRLCTEHIWSEKVVSKGINKKVLSECTLGIFLGDPAPNSELPIMQIFWSWLVWFVRLFCIHLVVRLFVMIGDTCCHDYHHRFPNSSKWPNYLFARQNDLLDTNTRWKEPYREVWGVIAAINLVFTSLEHFLPEPQENLRGTASKLYSLN